MDYKAYTDLVIDNLEGGYFHPDMYKANRAFFSNDDAGYANSGETYYGMDRKAGAPLTTTGPMVNFWALIDKYYTPYHANLDYWNEKDGYLRNRKTRSAIPLGLKDQLRQYVQQTMSAYFETYMKDNFTPEQANFIKSNPKILFNFWYAVWNGKTKFKSLADAFKTEYAKGTRDPETLYKVVMQKRAAILGTSRANKVAPVCELATKVGGGWLKWLLIAGIAGVAIYMIKK